MTIKRSKLENICLVLLVLIVTIFHSDTALTDEGLSRNSMVGVQKDEKGNWQLIVDNSPYIVKGVCYSPSVIGEDPDNATLRDWAIVDDNKNGRIDSAYDVFVDQNDNSIRDPNEPIIGDFKLMKEMGVNTVRFYHHASEAEEMKRLYNSETLEVLYNHPPNKELLRELYGDYGIMVMAGDFLGAHTNGSGADWEKGTDYRDLAQQDNMLQSVKRMVLDFREESFLLMYCIGNENDLLISKTNANQYPEIFAKFVNKAAKLIHEMDPDHPVCLCLGGAAGASMLSALARYAPEIDIIGINYYSRTGSFGDLWGRIKNKLDKPVLITEFGSLFVTPGTLFEDKQLKYHRTAWEDINRNLSGGEGQGNALGGFIFEWVDNWWQNGDPEIHKGMNEFCGITSQSKGRLSPYLRRLRKVYSYYQEAWGKEGTK